MQRNPSESALSSPSTWQEAARHSLQRQLILRFALVFLLVTFSGSLLALLGYQMLVQQSQRRSADEALRHLERSYATQQENWLRNADEVKSQIDFMRLFAQGDPATSWLRLRAYFAAIEGKLDRFPSGVVLDGGEGGGGPANPRFVVSAFNDLRPQLLAEATKNAREMAQQFAADSGARVGSIRSANQGQIQIFGTDGNDESGAFSPTSTVQKKIRVVSTFEFALE